MKIIENFARILFNIFAFSGDFDNFDKIRLVRIVMSNDIFETRHNFPSRYNPECTICVQLS